MEPGGSGDPYAGLTDEQRTVLQQATKQGFPLGGWWQYASLTGGAFTAVEGGIQALDASYVDDFWTLPGYEGSDPTVAAARIQHDTTVKSITNKEVVLGAAPPGRRLRRRVASAITSGRPPARRCWSRTSTATEPSSPPTWTPR